MLFRKGSISILPKPERGVYSSHSEKTTKKSEKFTANRRRTVPQITLIFTPRFWVISAISGTFDNARDECRDKSREMAWLYG